MNAAQQWHLRCIDSGATYTGDEPRYRSDTGGLLEVVHDLRPEDVSDLFTVWDRRFTSRDPLDRSGVWRYRELILPLSSEHIITRGEGNTTLYDSPRLAGWLGIDRVLLKHEGENPTGSFKDRGMTVGMSMARRLGMHRVACASTGNTSASLASYAAIAGMQAIVFIPEGRIAMGKLSQAIAHGALVIQIDGDFDRAMSLVQTVCDEQDVYLLNSINPFRIEGQKAIAFEVLQQLGWNVPDWLVLPGGNLGNSSAVFKGLSELQQLGLIDRIPRIAVIQAHGAAPLYHAYCGQFKTPLVPVDCPETLATAIRIGAPVSWQKCMRAITETQGIVAAMHDSEILEAKAQVDAAGIGAEPASCASVAGLKELLARGVVRPDEHVVCVLTGHFLKDQETTMKYHRRELDGIEPAAANQTISCPARIEEIRAILRAREE